MANIYVRSTDGNNADNGSTWALAKATVTGAAAIDALGDVIWVSQVHSEAGAGNVTPLFIGTEASPEAVICGNDSAEPPTALATGAVCTSVGNFSFTATNYVYGLRIEAGTAGASNSAVVLNNTTKRSSKFEQCIFRVLGNLAAATISIGTTGTGGKTTLVDCQYRFGSSNSGFSISSNVYDKNGSFVSGTSTPSILYRAHGSGGLMLIEGMDFTNLGTSFDVTIAPIPGSTFILRRVKFASGWSGNFIQTAGGYSYRTSMYNYTIGTSNFMVWIEDYAGVIKSETTLVMSDGASDGVTPFSWKMTSNANADTWVVQLFSDEMVIWSDAVGGSPDLQATITVEILHDSATNLTDAEVWLEVHYLGTGTSPLGAGISDRKASIVASAADQTASSATWTTTGMTNPNKQKLSVTVTPAKKGFYKCRVGLAKARKTIYVNPAPALS